MAEDLAKVKTLDEFKRGLRPLNFMNNKNASEMLYQFLKLSYENETFFYRTYLRSTVHRALAAFFNSIKSFLLKLRLLALGLLVENSADFWWCWLGADPLYFATNGRAGRETTATRSTRDQLSKSLSNIN